jgi:BlaI family transcriptional regulator, penicillinase repressor
MSRGKVVRISAGEMDLLRMLSEQGPLSLSAAHAAFEGYGGRIGYPTMQTRLNRLVAKGLVARSADRPALYRVLVSPDQAAAGLLRQLLDKLVTGSVAPLMLTLISERGLTVDEVHDLRQLLDKAEKSARRKTGRRK